MSDATRVLTAKVRISYAHVFEAVSMQEGQVPKFSVALLIDKSDTITLNRIKAAIEAAKEEGILKYSEKVQRLIKAKKPIPGNFKYPLHDGDVEREDNEEYAGKMYVNASNKRKPNVVGTEKDEGGQFEVLYDDEDFYSGCYGRATLNFFAFNNQSQGVGCSLENLQKLADGDRLGAARESAEDSFGRGEDDLLEDDLLGRDIAF